MIRISEYFVGKSHVIWDWNGTLLNDIHHAVNTVNRLLVMEKLPTIDVEKYRQAFGFPVISYYDRLGFDTNPENFKRLCEVFNQHFHDDLHLCELWPGVRETLTQVKTSGRVQSVLSASEQVSLVNSVRQFGLTDLFDHVVGIRDKMAASKVESGHQLMSRLSISKEETILIGDTDHDLEVGKALGIDVILVEHGHQTPDRLRAVHHAVVDVFTA